MGSRSFHCWLAGLWGLTATCILTAGCFSGHEKISIEDRLVGAWKRQDGDVEIVLWIADADKIFQEFRGTTVYDGDWTVDGDKLLLKPVIAKLATGEQLYVKDLHSDAFVSSYRILSIGTNAIHLEAVSDDGQPETFARMRYEQRLVGQWQSRNGENRMTFLPFDKEKGYGDYELLRGENEFKGEWHLAGKTLHLQLTVAKLDTGEEKDVAGKHSPVAYQLVSVRSGVLQLDPGDGQISTYSRVATTQNRSKP